MQAEVRHLTVLRAAIITTAVPPEPLAAPVLAAATRDRQEAVLLHTAHLATRTIITAAIPGHLEVQVLAAAQQEAPPTGTVLLREAVSIILHAVRPHVAAVSAQAEQAGVSEVQVEVSEEAHAA